MTSRPSLAAIAIAAGLVAALWGVTAHRIAVESDTAIEAAMSANANLAIAYEESTLAAFSGIDQLLQLAAIEYLHEGAKAEATVAEWPVNPGLVLGLALYDRDGRRVLSAGREGWPHSVPPESLAKDTGDALHVSSAEWDEADGHWHLTVSRPIRGVRGAFEGIAAARANLTYFTAFYRRADLGHNGVVTLVGRDGFARVRQAGGTSTFNVDMRSTLLMAHLDARPEGSFESRGQRLDLTRRLFSYRSLKNLPLVIMVGTDKSEALAAAGERARIYYGVAAAASLLVLLITAWATAAMARQRRDFDALTRVQGDLRRSEGNLRAVVESANQGIITYDRDLRITAANPVAERILGLSSAHLVRAHGITSLLTCVNEDGTPLLPEQRPSRITRSSGRPVSGQLIGIQRPEGMTQWISVNTGILQQQGSDDWFGVVSTLSDVTDQRAIETIMTRLLREVEENAAQFRATYNQALVGIGHADLDGRVLRANPRMCEILGYSESELLECPVMDLAHPEDAAHIAQGMQMLVSGRDAAALPETHRYLRKDGAIIWATTWISLVRKADGSPDYFLGMIQDVTDLKRAERLKDEFVSTVSHELRTPLTSISGSLALVAGGVTGVLPAAARKLVDVAADNCQRLIHLVNDLLDVERMASGKLAMQLGVSDLGPLLRASVRANEGFASQHGVALRLDAAPEALPANVDGGRLNQAVTNLVSNAVKFSPHDGVVEIVLRRRGDRARIEVRDRGPGIPLEFRARMFEKFSQADGSDARRMSGSGLGLSIARGLVERMGGTIDYDTVLGEGTTFFIEIPLADSAAPCAAGAPHNLEA